MKRTYLHPLPLRIWHWLNACIVIMLIVTGVYLRLHGIAALKPHDPVLLWHKYVGFAMIGSAVFWFIYAMSSQKRRRHYRIKRQHLMGILAQTEFYLISIFAGEENPFKATADDKYNPLQKIAYNAIMFVFLPVQAVTGLLFMSHPAFLSGSLIGLLGAIHAVFAYVLLLYLVVHLYMTTLGERVFSHTKAMITGYHEQSRENKEDEGRPVPAEASPEKR
jgi:thiosulfate reductase cytochrome b subunit